MCGLFYYIVKSWTGMINKLEAFELWYYKRSLRKLRMVNEEGLQRIGGERELLTHEKYELAQLIIEGKLKGKMGLGRNELSWMRYIRN